MELTAEQINEFLANAVLKSNIGVAVEAAVQKQIGILSKSYDNPFDSVIRNEVVALIQHEVADKHREALRERVAEAVANHLTDDMVAKIVTDGIGKLLRGY